jgi:hypothetical protein
MHQIRSSATKHRASEQALRGLVPAPPSGTCAEARPDRENRQRGDGAVQVAIAGPERLKLP